MNDTKTLTKGQKFSSQHMLPERKAHDASLKHPEMVEKQQLEKVEKQHLEKVEKQYLEKVEE